MMQYPTITALTAAVLGVFYVLLSMRVGLFRASSNIFLGDGGNAAMLKRIRVHGNFAEYVPLVLILLALIEGMGAPAYIVLGTAVTFVIVRVAHAISLSASGGRSVGRAIGGLGTIMMLLGISLWLGVMAAQNLLM